MSLFVETGDIFFFYKKLKFRWLNSREIVKEIYVINTLVYLLYAMLLYRLTIAFFLLKVYVVTQYYSSVNIIE